MKKFIIGFGVFIIYIVYSIGIRHERPILSKPAALAKLSSSKSHKSALVPPPTAKAMYKDGNYTGNVDYVYYGNVQVSVAISGGKITDVKFLQFPNEHSTSVYINNQAMPYLRQEAIQSQNPNKVQIISGATFTSQGFIESLKSALSKA
jgi:uncharacterized protein with FMN-binding domain